jgi:Gnt-I system high-affinity gluconate transporter
VGIPLFYNVGFVLLVPLAFTVSYQYKLPAVYVGIPLLAALSVTHGFLPPHPSPAALVAQFDANMGLTLFYGFIIAIPTIIIAGPLFAPFLKNIKSQPLKTFQAEPKPEHELPGIGNSIFHRFASCDSPDRNDSTEFEYCQRRSAQPDRKFHS